MLRTLLLAHLAYVAGVGGDRFEFRFLDPVWPVAMLVVLALRDIARRVLPTCVPNGRAGPTRRWWSRPRAALLHASPHCPSPE
jgi:hypothetical protein